MTGPHHIYFLVYEGFEILDLSGPASVFNSANHQSGITLYQIHTVSMSGGQIGSSSGIHVDTEQTTQITLNPNSTVLVVGAEQQSLLNIIKDHDCRKWLRATVVKAARFGSICSGTLVLAAADLLAQRSVTTHWLASKPLCDYHPNIEVLADQLYVVDGNLWTSAGVTTGIDMALAMIAKDHHKALMTQVARRLVVYAHRPGNQSQFSSLLEAQASYSGHFADLIAWLDNQLHQPIKVADMAAQVNMSERSFHRKFSQAIGITPSKYLELSRLERARQLLETELPIKTIAANVGFRSEAGFRTAYESRYDLSPSLHRKMIHQLV